jgi:hypothetical protein
LELLRKKASKSTTTKTLVTNKKEETATNLLELIPVRNIGWKKNASGLIVLLKPKFTHPFFKKHLLSRMKKPHYTIRLDEMGSAVWELCDGRLTVKEVGESLRDKYKEKIEPLYDRLSLYLQNLERNRFIVFKREQG